MKLNVARWLAVALGVAVLGCVESKHGARVTGEYTRYGAQMSQGGYVLPTLPEGALTSFPSTVRFVSANGFEVDGGIARYEGKYRLERDSIFLDAESSGETRLAFAGRLFGDTLHLHWIPDYEVGPDSTEAEWQLFFVRSK